MPSHRITLLVALPLVALLPLASATPSEAQPVPRRVADLETTPLPANSAPEYPVEVGGRLYFAADDSISGRELWSTDGTAEGTRRVFDLEPGKASSGARPMGALGDLLIFQAQGTLWSTDGTAEGTRILVEPDPDTPCSGPFFDAGEILGDQRIFSGCGPEGAEPWITDGTPEGTRLLVDLAPGPAYSASQHFTRLGDRLYFVAQTPETGSELWSTDGTTEGTRLLADICPGACSSSLWKPAVLGDRLIFSANDGMHGPEPWITDGTPEGTRLLADVIPGPTGPLAALWQPFADQLFAIGFECGDRRCLVRTDGTSEGTVQVPDLLPPDREPVDLSITADRLFIAARAFVNPGDPGDPELWAWDGVEVQRVFVDESLVYLDLLDTVGERALAGALVDDFSGSLLIASDGTPEGTSVISGSIVYWSAPLGDRLLLGAGTEPVGLELFVTDGTAEGTGLLKDIAADRADAELRTPVDWNGRLAFSAGREPSAWRTDGTAVELLAQGHYFDTLIPSDDRLFAYSSGRSELSAFDAAGERQQIPLETAPEEGVAVGDRLYFRAGFFGQQLWTSDGTEAGTRRVIDLNPSWNPSFFHSGPQKLSPPPPPVPPFPSELAPVAGGVVFAATTDGRDAQLWYSGATAESTRLLHTFDSSRFIYEEWPRHLAGTGERQYFIAHEDAAGHEVWLTDGTVAGTRMAADLAPGEASMPTPEMPVAYQDGVAFVEIVENSDPNDDIGSRIHWVRPDGPTVLAEYGPKSRVRQLAVSGNQLYALVKVGVENRLYLNEGSRASNRRLDLAPGVGSVASVHAIADLGALVGFDDGSSGVEPWVTNGTEHRRLGDLYPGPESSSPDLAVVAGDRLYFEADDGVTGRELWTVGLADLLVPCFEALCLRGDRFRVRTAWHTADGESGFAQVAFESGIGGEADDSGLLYFFEPDNWEMLIKVLDGCALNGHYWVYAAVSTDVGLYVEVTDLLTGEVWTWEKPAGTTTPALTATDALATCP